MEKREGVSWRLRLFHAHIRREMIIVVSSVIRHANLGTQYQNDRECTNICVELHA